MSAPFDDMVEPRSEAKKLFQGLAERLDQRLNEMIPARQAMPSDQGLLIGLMIDRAAFEVPKVASVVSGETGSSQPTTGRTLDLPVAAILRGTSDIYDAAATPESLLSAFVATAASVPRLLPTSGLTQVPISGPDVDPLDRPSGDAPLMEPSLEDVLFGDERMAEDR